jgi:AraC family L-rhamnose operon regulatory protein RhaS
MIHAGLTDILSWLLGVKTDKPLTEIEETVYRVIQHLQGHYREPIGMDELAGIAGFSKYHLSREFHRLTGYAPISYLLMIRMEHAGFLLLNTDLSISQISEQCGFNSEQYMCRQFQKHFGTTPGRYRRLYRS